MLSGLAVAGGRARGRPDLRPHPGPAVKRPRPGPAVDLAVAQIWVTASSTASHGEAEADPPDHGDFQIQKRER
ncbi:hypothetical protein NL676_029841 [Syzygium grande]|nr:hypothetical protein NL676_029841 [Syzygium grande]